MLTKRFSVSCNKCKTLSYETTRKSWSNFLQIQKDSGRYRADLAWWNFHYACGALDGKHITILAPTNHETVYHNYEGFFTIIIYTTGTCRRKLYKLSYALHKTVRCSMPSHSHMMTSTSRTFSLKTMRIHWEHGWQSPSHTATLIGDKIIFNYRLSSRRTALACWHKDSGAFSPACNRNVIVMTWVCLNNLMKLLFPALQNLELDREKRPPSHGNLCSVINCSFP